MSRVVLTRLALKIVILLLFAMALQPQNYLGTIGSAAPLGNLQRSASSLLEGPLGSACNDPLGRGGGTAFAFLGRNFLAKCRVGLPSF